MGVPRPEDMFPRLEQALNSGDIEAALALYEDDAAFVTGDGELARGREGLRAVFDGMVNAKIITKGAPVRTMVVKDLALVFVQYTGTVPLPDGKEMQLSGLSTDVLRQQSDGTWLSVIDNPFGTALVAGQSVAQEIIDAVAAAS